jgi:DMSO/TMAO reductase YedYZ molybdopterin-dependent catalytic subunit
MQTAQKPSLWSGALIGLLLTAPLLALFFLGERLIGLPLVPLDFFDAIVPLIPGGLITIVIDIMVDTIIGLGQGEEVDTVAKTIEQAMAFGMVLGLGAVVGAVFYGLGANYRDRATIVGAGIGLVLGLIFGGMSLFVNFFEVPAAVAFLWVVGLFTAWGVALGWTFRDLGALPVSDKSTAPEASVDTLGRHDFVVRVGGASATLTLVGAGLGIALAEDEATPQVAESLTTPEAEATEEAIVSGGEEVVTMDDGRLPNADALPEPAPGMRPEYTPVEEHYRIDIATRPIEIDLATWTLPFSGLVQQEVEFTMDQLRNNYEHVDQYVTMQCISNRIGGNLISTTKWTGVPVRDVLADVELDENAGWLRIEGGDSFFEYLSLEQVMNDPEITFVFDFDDRPLPQRNGFPLRVYIPDLYGMKQPKWINNIIVTESDERGYWVRRGWSAEAVMQQTSVVDTIAVNDVYVDEEGAVRVPIGGYAIAGVRGTSKVEISINDGEWFEAELRQPISDRTWTFWRYDWAFEEGMHNVAVRSYDREGNLQTLEEQPVRPDGATGIHMASATLPSPQEIDA